MPGALRIRELFVYPLKSAAGLRVTDAAIDEMGLAGDRRWMAVDREGQFLSQRRVTRMARLQATALPDGSLFLSGPWCESLHVPPPSEAFERPVTVWEDRVQARDAGDEAAAWLSRALETDARLVHGPSGRGRTVDPTYAQRGDRVAFADGFPLLIVGEASLRDINARLAAGRTPEVGVERFRPNIVIEGGEPFEEDRWRRIAVGTGDEAIEIDIVKPCARCSIISVDPRTGTQGVEPMRTLATYRRCDGEVYVGQNATLRASAGRIVTGATVTVLS